MRSPVPTRLGCSKYALLTLLAVAAACSPRGKSAAPAPARAAAVAQTTVVNVPGTPVQLTARRMTGSVPSGTVPMWGFCASGTCTSAWAPGPTIVATAGDSLTINLTNTLPVPTSLVVLGQLGGGLGAPATMASPAHSGQSYSTFVGNAPATPFVPPAQADRVRSFGTEVAGTLDPTTATSATLTWASLKPGTYLYEAGTLPSLEVPMGLYGVLVVKPAAGAPPYGSDAEASLLFSEIDPVQNAAVDAAAVANADVNKRWNDPSCSATTPCYPAAVNYAPTYFLVNGQSFDRTQPQLSQLLIAGASTVYQSGNLLLRLANAGSRTHIPATVGASMALVAEDGNPLPGIPRTQAEVLLTAGKTYDVLVASPKSTLFSGAYAPATYPIFDRQLSLSAANRPDAGMQAYLLVNADGARLQGTCSNGATTVCTTDANCGTGGSCVGIGAAGNPGTLPAAVTPVAVNDSYLVPYQTPFSANVTANDIAVYAVSTTSLPAHGTLAMNADGSFTYTPAARYSGADAFTYVGNGGAAGSATVALSVAAMGVGGPPVAQADTYTSQVAGSFSVPRPGVLANDSDPSGYPLTAQAAVPGTGCGGVTLNLDGSFAVTTSTPSAPSCSFTYQAMNSQGTSSAPATVTVSFATPSNLQVVVMDAVLATTIDDYRWTLQEDLTFVTTTMSTNVSARTVATSFHRSHMPVVATGCVGPVSCGAGQAIRSDATTVDPVTGTLGARHVVTPAEAVAKQVTPSQVSLDPTKRYFLSILPGDGSPPSHTMGGASIVPKNGAWPAVKVRLQGTPLPTAQMSIFVYEDNSPTNGMDDPNETGLGGFNVILMDPAGRTGDVAGQQTYDAFNMPLSNALLGSPGCPDVLNQATNGAATTPGGNMVGAVYTCPNPPPGYTGDPAVYSLAGHALIKNLTPARYDVIAHPAAAREAAGEVWWQTETLEGTPAQDAFVGVNEPVYFQEFGPPGPHVTIGFVNPGHLAVDPSLVGSGTITGSITNSHMSRPSNTVNVDAGTYDLLGSTTCKVILNSQAGDGPAFATAECDQLGNFVVSNVAPGTYDLEIIDEWLDQIIQNVAVTVPPPTASTPRPTVALGTIPVLSWFTQYDQNIFMDLNKNGIYDAGEPGISNVPLTVRYRNGALSNTTLSDSNGNGILAELFPLFNWYVAEADTTRFKQTGVHVVVDGGGVPDSTGDGAHLWSSHYADGVTTSVRTEIPGALSYGLQGFISQRNRVDWGRTNYVAGENGGIVGTVVYSSTRPFDDMRFNVQTIWEPLVPRVPVNLYQKQTLGDGTSTLVLVDSTQTSSFDDYANLVNGAGGVTSSLGKPWWVLGSDGKLRDPSTGAPAPAAAYPAGTQVNFQCPGQLPGPTTPAPWDLSKVDPFTNYTLGNDQYRCYDGWHDWNQVQAAPYDGRYVFPSAAYVAQHPLSAAQKAAGQTLVSLPPGEYVVEAVTPPGYEIVKEEDKNILIGDTFTAAVPQQFGSLASIFILPDQATLYNSNPYDPGTGDPGFQSDPTSNLGLFNVSNAATFPECVGSLHRVPDYLSLFPQAQQVAPFAGMDRPLCDRKKVILTDQAQASATFFVFTETPVASNNTGIILDDATSEFNAAAPDFGEKATVPFVPVSIKDYTGLEIGRTLSDQWGAYNMMTPSSWLVNPPTPSGYGPNMLITCINDPGPIPDPVTGALVTDPAYNPAYSNFCYTNPYMPGQTTYLDTPVLPVAAFAAGYNPADCALPDATPNILRVDGSGIGPWVPATGGTLTIQAQGDVQVPNPAYAGPFATSGLASQRTLTRHYGFGGRGTASSVNLCHVVAGTTVCAPLGISSWSDTSISAIVPPTAVTGELVITTASGRTSVDTVTVTVGGKAPTVVEGAQGITIQSAVDAAQPGDLIIVDAGTYDELVVMWKPVRLQGVGAASVIVNAAKYPNTKLDAWRPKINALFSVDTQTGNVVGTPQVDPLPTQEITGGIVRLEPSVLGAEEGAGFTVLAKHLDPGACAGGMVSSYGALITDSNFWCAPSRIDGFSVTGGDAGGGVYVNGWAHGLELSNNRIYGNAGAYHGGVRVGVPYLELEAYQSPASGPITGFGYDQFVRIHHNQISRNGTVEAPAGEGGAGGGVAICTGTDDYSIDHNWICGNYSAADGGGIGHLGFSQGGTIASNRILFNQSFQQTNTTHGGGIFVGGEPPIAGTLTLGTGDLTIDSNLIRGNFAEGGHGGGIRLQRVNGEDVVGRVPASWNKVILTNNMIENNVAGWAGGGISLSDTLRASIANNTIASNDSTGIAGAVLASGVPLPATIGGTAGTGYPSPAGLVTEPTSPDLLAALPTGMKTAQAVSQPIQLANNILWQNRSFYYSGNGKLCVGNSLATAAGTASTGACTVLPDQVTSSGTGKTGLCPAGAAYWDLGVLNDASTTPGTIHLSPTYSVITSTSGYTGTTMPGNRSGNPRLANPYCNGSRLVPELGTVLNPPGVLNFQVAATIDEGNNYVNLRYGPLYLENPVSKATFGNYHLGSTDSSAYNNGTTGGQIPAIDYDGQARPYQNRWDIGADEWWPAGTNPPALPW